MSFLFFFILFYSDLLIIYEKPQTKDGVNTQRVEKLYKSRFKKGEKSSNVKINPKVVFIKFFFK